jgi:hypothetical protein
VCKGEAHGDFERGKIPVDSKPLNSAIDFFLVPSDGTLQKLGKDCLCEYDAPPRRVGWASHHWCAKWRGIFEANASCHQGQNHGFSVLPMEREHAAQHLAKRWAVTSLPLNWMVLEIKPQEGIGWPSAPLSRGPDGRAVDVQGTMLNVAPVSTKYLLLVN